MDSEAVVHAGALVGRIGVWGQPPSAVLRAPALANVGRTLLSASAEVSTIFAIQQVPHGFAARRVRAFVGLQGISRFCPRVAFLFTARRTAIGEAGLARLELELFATNGAGFDRIGRHHLYFIAKLDRPFGARNRFLTAPSARFGMTSLGKTIFHGGIVRSVTAFASCRYVKWMSFRTGAQRR